MPNVNTFNYDTIASWNGSDDLFVVEQPDGTKVATPAMVKQFIEAGDFAATGNIEDGDGNQLADIATKLGDPASASGVTGDDAFAKISALNSNLTPTINVDIASYLQPNCSVNEYIRYSKYGKLVIVDIGGLTANITTAAAFLKANALPIMRTRALGVLSNDRGDENTVAEEGSYTARSSDELADMQ